MIIFAAVFTVGFAFCSDDAWLGVGVGYAQGTRAICRAYVCHWYVCIESYMDVDRADSWVEGRLVCAI